MRLKAIVHLDPEFIRMIPRARTIVNEEFDKAMDKAIYEVEERAKDNAPVDTGRLQSSITKGAPKTLTRKISPYQGVVGSKVKYAAIQEYGGRTPPRDIYPRRKKALYWPGARHPVKRVHHPGGRIRGKRYLRGALEYKLGRIRIYFVKATLNILRRVGFK